MPTPAPRYPEIHLVIAAGLSGAGVTQTLKILEDIGFACVAQLPAELLPATLEHFQARGIRRVALSLALPDGEVAALVPRIDALRAQVARLDVLFLEAGESALVGRFSETRRRHRMSPGVTLTEAIERERTALTPIHDLATTTIATDAMTLSQLRARVASAVGSDLGGVLDVTFLAFGFKYGLPPELDLLFDVRFLANPNYDPELRERLGSDPAVAAFIERDDTLEPFLERARELVGFLLPLYKREGKTRVTIGIGCTGGRHRSLYVAHRLSGACADIAGVESSVAARDIGR
ncbi:MAG: RNase adapter RapZ [Candidatus Eremiobacteraeota bacterium]|uniref:Putative ATPase/kinase n=1 Tax=mine drainage metagenome TaxID=410659 RepID=E6PC04_9ZZZZ|nr:RNase adapter RapZ [Candidatus Eremiobacteraeota bacterium]